MQNEKEKTQKVSTVALVEALFKRFRRFEDFFCRDWIKKVSFRDVTLDMLKIDCDYNEASDIRSEYLGRKVLFFSKQGGYVGQVGKKKLPARKDARRRFLWWSWTTDIQEKTVLFQETIGEALERLKRNDTYDEAHFVVACLNEDGSRTPSHLVIGSPPNGKTIKEQLDAELQQAESLVIRQVGPTHK